MLETIYLIYNNAREARGTTEWRHFREFLSFRRKMSYLDFLHPKNRQTTWFFAVFQPFLRFFLNKWAKKCKKCLVEMKMSVYLHRRKRGLASECSRILGIFDEKILTTRCVGANAEEAFAAALFL